MGIKFRCPNGHKLNVKSHQAGKKGYCPKCDSQVQIPLKSQRKGKAERAAERAARRAAAQDPATTPVVSAMPVATRIAPTSEAPVATLPVAPTVAPTDPITTNPELIWYVRPPNGSQFGPAKGDLMLSWIQEGRVGPDALVWQEGWPDWKPASEIFPQLAAPPAPDTHAAEDTESALGDFNFNEESPAGSNEPTRRLNSRRKPTNSTPIVVSFLAVLAVILIGILVWVLNPR